MKMHQAMICLASQMSVVKVLEELPQLLDKNIRFFEEEIRSLSAPRDNLLPKLISGELRVPDTEKFIREVGI